VAKVLFVMLQPGFIRYVDGGLRELAAAGHDVHVAFEINRGKLGEDETARRLAASSPRITCGPAPERAESVRAFLARSDRDALRSGGSAGAPSSAQAWESLATTVRLAQDYLRFFDPAFAGAGALRARAEKRLPRVHARLVRAVARLGRPARMAAARVLALVEQMIPIPEDIERFVREQAPDVLAVAPLVELGSQQVDYVKAARRLGVPSVLPVASWDNLTSKGLMRVVPDHVLVWNEAQKREAAELHGVPPARVAVTGAVPFDRWFDAAPTRSREAFCRRLGLDPARPYVLYVGSSVFIAPDEVPFAARWIAALRQASDPAVAALGILLRPHPANARQWGALDVAALPGVALWPPAGTDPTDGDFWTDYFESIHYSAAVVGINTSAQIEAAIVGRPVLTVRAPEFAHAQGGTLHFRHLVGQGGAVREAGSLDEHVAQLDEVLRGRVDPARARTFVRDFVRPAGLDQPVAPLFARHVAAIAGGGRRPEQRDPAWVRIVRPVALAAAAGNRQLTEDRPLWVYALRPWVGVGVQAAAVVYRARRWAHEARLPLKRARRAAWRAWYEPRRAAGRYVYRAGKSLGRVVRLAGGAARRVVRRQP
jgi:hypothetical protein